jgi:hypothetical protein
MQYGDFWSAVATSATVASLVGAAVGTYVRLTVRSALAEFRAQLVEDLNGRYYSRREADRAIDDICRRLEKLEKFDGKR